MLKCERDTCADQRVFTYLYFSHARIRAARICLINTFPGGLSRGYSNFSWGHAAVRRNFDVARISKNRFSPSRAFFNRLHGARTRLQHESLKQNDRPYEADFYLPTTTGINSLGEFIDVESARNSIRCYNAIGAVVRILTTCSFALLQHASGFVKLIDILQLAIVFCFYSRMIPLPI